MKTFFNGVAIGIVLGAVGFWFVQKQAQAHPEAQQKYMDSAARAGAAMRETAASMSDAFKAKLDTLDLNADQVRDELTRTGQIVRRKAVDIGDQAADAASDLRAVTEIKAKYAGDSTLSAWRISVACNHGHVTLSGAVSSPEDVGKAIALALDADGVRDVSSTLQVKTD